MGKTLFEKTNDPSGKPNPKYVDVLSEDAPIAGQSFGCFSFLSPENILKQKNHFMFEQFLKTWALKKSMGAFSSFIGFLSHKYTIPMEEITASYEEFVEEEDATLKKISIFDQYHQFLSKNEEELEQKFNIQNKFQTSTRGVKNRGNFSTLEEAEMRAKLLREKDPNFDIFVGPVGQWLVWDPNAYKTGDTQYMNDELNQLVHEKDKNQALAKAEFDKRVLDTKRKAIEKNVEAARKSGNKLTQTINDKGELIGIHNTQEAAAIRNSTATDIPLSDVSDVLFGGNVATDSNNDHGQSLLTNNPFTDIVQPKQTHGVGTGIAENVNNDTNDDTDV